MSLIRYIPTKGILWSRPAKLPDNSTQLAILLLPWMASTLHMVWEFRRPKETFDIAIHRLDNDITWVFLVQLWMGGLSNPFASRR